MKRLAILVLALLMLGSLVGCATTKAGAKVKCPACGYEFEAPATS